MNRQWVRNVQKTSKVRPSIGDQTFDGNARFLADRAEHERAMAAIRRKYWMFRPIIALGRVAAWRARSPALLAFGGDSAIELLSASVVLWRFRADAARELAERLSARIAGTLSITGRALTKPPDVLSKRQGGWHLF